MWKITPPVVGDINSQLDRALIHKDGTIVYQLSDAERTAITELYRSYDELGGEPNLNLTPAALDQCKDALFDAYGQVQKGGRLEQFRGRLLAAVIECPLCGFEAATTLDHYLPKDEYRALAIYARNLVPCCQPCNRAKGTLAPVAGEGMIHAYFQFIPDVTFLVADVHYDAGALVTTFRIDDTHLPANLVERLEFQLARLKLNTRYIEPINIFLFSLKPALKLFRGQPNEAEQIKAFLLASADEYDQDFKLNHWRTALLRGLAACDEFLVNPWSYFDQPLHVVAVA